MTYGYARVSSRDQCEDRQIISLESAGVTRDNIVIDKQSGKDFDRPKYQALVHKMRKGDTLMVTSIDRLGRNYDEILEQWRLLTKERGFDIVVLDMPLLDTRSEKGLTGRLISDIVLQLLSYVAQSERENIKKRQAEGIEAARARGVKFGRPMKDIPDNFDIYAKKVENGEITQTAAAEKLGMALSSFRHIYQRDGYCNPPKRMPTQKKETTKKKETTQKNTAAQKKKVVQKKKATKKKTTVKCDKNCKSQKQMTVRKNAAVKSDAQKRKDLEALLLERLMIRKRLKQNE